jgi:hypothetical protein
LQFSNFHFHFQAHAAQFIFQFSVSSAPGAISISFQIFHPNSNRQSSSKVSIKASTQHLPDPFQFVVFKVSESMQVTSRLPLNASVA